MFALPLVAVLALVSQVAGAPSTRQLQRRAAHNAQAAAVERAPRPARHAYLLQNATLAARVQARASSGRATFYHPEWEGESATGSCGGQAMNDHTMGVALSSPGWAYFAQQGISKQDLCWKSITIQGTYGTQKAQIMDTCPSHGATGTCFDICDIDLTYGLFGMLDNHDRGIVPVQWSFDDGTPNPCGAKGGSNNNNNNNNNNDNKNNGDGHQQQSKSSWSAPSTTTFSSTSRSQPPPSSSSWSRPKASWKPSSSAPSQSQAKQHIATSSSSLSAPSSSVSSTETATKKPSFKTELQWWENVDPQWCPGVHTPEGVPTVAVGPNDAYPGDKLSDTCGKWITIVNSEGKKTEAQIVMWLPGFEPNFVAVGTAFGDIINDGPTHNITWSFN